uniref:Neuronal acetylcholine receptor subunit alpha-7 n=1 Tax=Aceria tosichella TaxID=561515 RepID=A0A6G1S7I9_9ACAR
MSIGNSRFSVQMSPSRSFSTLRLAQIAAIVYLVCLPKANCLDGNATEAPDESPSLKKLRQELLITRQYDKVSRPVKNHLTQTKVDMRITINEFVDLDTVNSMLVTDAWFHISWRDEFLSWDPNDYQQLKQIHMNPNEIWKPDIVLINTAYQDNLINIFTESEVLVNSTGDVTWITMGLLRSKCPIWAYDYPFTIRPVNCRLTFCSLIYQSHEVNITTPGNEFYLAGPWFVNPRLQFINITGERYEKYYDSYGTYSFESLTVQLKRRDNALPMIIRVPTLAAILLTLCMWFLPINWPVRIHLALMAILIQLFLILYIGLQLGVNAIGLARPVSYLRDDLFLTCLALTTTLVFRRLLALADWLPPVPYFLSSLLSGPIAKLLCFGINSNDYVKKPSMIANQSKSMTNPFGSRTISPKRLVSGGSSSHLGDQVSLVDDDNGNSMGRQDASSGLGSGAGSTSLDIPCDAMANSLDQVVYLSGGQYEWMQIIIFCDRVMFVFYALFMIPRLT